MTRGATGSTCWHPRLPVESTSADTWGKAASRTVTPRERAWLEQEEVVDMVAYAALPGITWALNESGTRLVGRS